MSELQAKLVRGAFRVMQSRQFVRFLQDQRVLTLLVDGMSLRARAQVRLRELGTGAAQALGLATLADLRELERQLKVSAPPRSIDRQPKKS